MADSSKERLVPGALQPDERTQAVWSEWLQALTRDPEAAMAAADVYKRMNDEERDAWLRALERDLASFEVPAVAVYAPLLAVESNEARRTAMVRAMSSSEGQGGELEAGQRVEMRALVGGERDQRVAVLISSLYLDFAHVVACGYQVAGCFHWVKHDPIVRLSEAPKAGVVVEGIVLEQRCVGAVVDELAETILAHQRTGHALPEALCLFSDWFSPWLQLPKPSFSR